MYLEIMQNLCFQCADLQELTRRNSNQNFGCFRRGKLFSRRNIFIYVRIILIIIINFVFSLLCRRFTTMGII